MEMEKKNVAIIILAIALIGSGVGNIIFAVQLGLVVVEPEIELKILLFGDTVGPDDLDPHTCYDTGGSNVIEQVCEGLYAFNLTDPDYALMPLLASALPTVNDLTLTIPLRTGVTFTDGTVFNATVVKWNFDRLSHFLNYSGNSYLPAPFNVPLPSTTPKTQFANLITIPGVPERIPVINETKVVDAYTVNITLNSPRASLINLFAFSGFAMMSPEATPTNDYIPVYGRIVGTGPFIYDHYVGDVELLLLANKNYWQGAPKLDGVKYIYYTTDTVLNEAMLAGDIDMSDNVKPTYIPTFDANADITLGRGDGGINTNFMVFNPDYANKTWREAMSFAVNYSYIIDIDWLGTVNRLKSPIPTGVAFSTYDYGADFNLTRARSVMQSMGFGTGFTSDSDWTTVADGSSPFLEINLKVDNEDTDAINQANTVGNSFRYIGVDCTVDVSLTFDDIVDLIFSDHTQLELFNIGWKPDYIDPENFVDLFFTTGSILNIGNYSNPTVDALLAAGNEELDFDTRAAIYDDLQRIICGEDFVHIFISTPKGFDVWRNEVKGWVMNSIASHWFYPMDIVFD